ncbi:hypothetical protein BLNAU_1461 [Blattamonas nauphoetae]|uniref:Uncharacterized protein n=1 Tax=Blattamonas nauphoetae TaxID=2049346 RepID=A0ABQ9YI57_9EUKA|nr:hypothetical protein BLNAU_1461 [Blattamonas nauphoetae]
MIEELLVRFRFVVLLAESWFGSRWREAFEESIFHFLQCRSVLRLDLHAILNQVAKCLVLNCIHLQTNSQHNLPMSIQTIVFTVWHLSSLDLPQQQAEPKNQSSFFVASRFLFRFVVLLAFFRWIPSLRIPSIRVVHFLAKRLVPCLVIHHFEMHFRVIPKQHPVRVQILQNLCCRHLLHHTQKLFRECFLDLLRLNRFRILDFVKAVIEGFFRSEEFRLHNVLLVAVADAKNFHKLLVSCRGGTECGQIVGGLSFVLIRCNDVVCVTQSNFHNFSLRQVLFSFLFFCQFRLFLLLWLSFSSPHEEDDQEDDQKQHNTDHKRKDPRKCFSKRCLAEFRFRRFRLVDVRSRE